MRDLSPLTINVGDSLLTVVPAVHYRVAFAEAVNEMSRDARSRPDLIAVESSPSMTLQAAQWLRELGIGPAKRTRLPCLLGLVARQRYIAPALSDKALALQLHYGCALHELPPDVLDRELKFRHTRLLPLSPTDSITEAIRCALELNVPVLGIDLEEHAAIEAHMPVFPDVATPASRLSRYLETVAAHANALEVGAADIRRELAMAARLKELLSCYPRILFTCGLAHWQRIIGLVQDPTVRATSNVFSLALRRTSGPARRTLVDPSLAFQFLDRLPAVAEAFERRRRHPLLDSDRRRARSISVPQVYASAVRRGIRDHLRTRDTDESKREFCSAGTDRLVEFPSRVLAYSALGLNETPSVAQTLRCAKSFVSEDYAASLATTLLRFRWAKPKEFPKCAVLRGAMQPYTSQETVRVERRRVLPEPIGIDGIDEPEWISIERPDRDETKRRSTSTQTANSYLYTWTPWEHLITGASDEAITTTFARQAPRVAEPFQGSASDKIAWKDTLRNRIRGGNELYVYREPSTQSLQPQDASEGWPVVWIFDTEDRSASEWKHYVVPMSWVIPYLDNASQRSIPNVASSNALSALICFGDDEHSLATGPDGSDVQASRLRGIVAYGPIFNLNQQYARWLKLTNGSRNPCFRQDTFGIPKGLMQRCATFGPAFGALRWQDDIVRLAIPYGGRQITIIRPRSFGFDTAVYRAAAQSRKRLELVDLERFAADDIERARSNLMVPGVGNGNGPDYAADAEAAIAEDRMRYANRMPDKWSGFGL